MNDEYALPGDVIRIKSGLWKDRLVTITTRPTMMYYQVLPEGNVSWAGNDNGIFIFFRREDYEIVTRYKESAQPGVDGFLKRQRDQNLRSVF